MKGSEKGNERTTERFREERADKTRQGEERREEDEWSSGRKRRNGPTELR